MWVRLINNAKLGVEREVGEHEKASALGICSLVRPRCHLTTSMQLVCHDACNIELYCRHSGNNETLNPDFIWSGTHSVAVLCCCVQSRHAMKRPLAPSTWLASLGASKQSSVHYSICRH